MLHFHRAKFWSPLRPDAPQAMVRSILPDRVFAQISILVGELIPRPDTLKQIG